DSSHSVFVSNSTLLPALLSDGCRGSDLHHQLFSVHSEFTPDTPVFYRRLLRQKQHRRYVSLSLSLSPFLSLLSLSLFLFSLSLSPFLFYLLLSLSLSPSLFSLSLSLPFSFFFSLSS